MTVTVTDKLAELGQHEPLFIEPEATLRQAAERMWDSGVGLLVVGDRSHALGVLSERDIVIHLARGGDADATTVGQAMTKTVVTVRGEDFIHEAAYVMLEEEMRHVPVSDDEGHVVGMISIRDLLRPLLVESLEHRSAS